MTNEERIKRWRERAAERAAAQALYPALPPELALVAMQGEALASSEPGSGDETLALVIAELADVPQAGTAERRQIYDAMAMGLDRASAQHELPLELVELHRRQLRAIIRLIEADVRQGQDIAADGYRPEGLHAACEKLVEAYRRNSRRKEEDDFRALRRRAALAGEAVTIAVQPDEEADLIHLRQNLAEIDATRDDANIGAVDHELRSLAALFSYMVKLIAAESRLALVWALIGPALLLSLILSLYLLGGVNNILNMDVPTFAMLGATTWIMFRQIIFRTSTAIHSQTSLINIPSFSTTSVGLIFGGIYLSIYTMVFLILIAAGHAIDLFSLPADWAGFGLYVFAMGVSGIALGVIFGAIAVIWPFFLRLAPVIERTLQVFSGVFFVSEQFPVAFRPYFLWSPFAHGMQLLRSAYFNGYKSSDASPLYFLTSIAVLVVIAFFSQRVVRSRSQPS